MEEENDLNKKFKFDFSGPTDTAVDIAKLKKFLKNDKNTWIEFYGGEPLLQLDKMREIMQNINAKFVMQTNGKLLNQLNKEDLKKLEKILVSIDGDEERTEANRGAGTYETIIKNIQDIRKKGFKGEIVARMAISFPDIFEQVKHLTELADKKNINEFHAASKQEILCANNSRPQANYLGEGGRGAQTPNKKIFDSVHWQLDAGFYKHDFNEKEFKKFVKQYNSEVTKLVDFWINEMKGDNEDNKFRRHFGAGGRGNSAGGRNICVGIQSSIIKKGRVLKLYPFLAIIESLLKNEPTRLRCGSGYANYTITTNGKITACPIMSCMTDFYVGDLDSKIDKLKQISLDEPCASCNQLDLCGGRCLYANKTKLWPPEGQKLICETIIHLINSLKEKIPKIQKLIQEEKISIKDFEYEKYFGPEIIP
jgi:uncharacterized protein